MHGLSRTTCRGRKPSAVLLIAALRPKTAMTSQNDGVRNELPDLEATGNRLPRMPDRAAVAKHALFHYRMCRRKVRAFARAHPPYDRDPVRLAAFEAAQVTLAFIGHGAALTCVTPPAQRPSLLDPAAPTPQP